MGKKYGIIESTSLVSELLVIPHENGDLTVSWPTFGLDVYAANLESMGKNYFHPLTGERISFRPATTSESISAVVYDFENLAGPEIFDTRRLHRDPGRLQLGYIVKMKDGIFTNTKETDENKLKHFLNKAEKVNEIYLLDNRIAFAPYESFKRKDQDSYTFVNGGLARALEHTEEKHASKLKEISKNYEKGVKVWGFDEVKEPVLRVANLSIGSATPGVSRGTLGWFFITAEYSDLEGRGHAFGVLKD